MPSKVDATLELQVILKSGCHMQFDVDTDHTCSPAAIFESHMRTLVGTEHEMRFLPLDACVFRVGNGWPRSCEALSNGVSLGEVKWPPTLDKAEVQKGMSILA